MRTCGAEAFDPESVRAIARERSHVPRNSRGQPMAKKMQSTTDRRPAGWTGPGFGMSSVNSVPKT
jgi:hypothetical protein